MSGELNRDDDTKAGARAVARLPWLLYLALLVGVYGFLMVMARFHGGFMVFFGICFAVSLLPIIGVGRSLARSGALLAVSLLVMSLLSAGFLQGDYRTLPANMDITIEISSEDMPGIAGPQRITTDAKGYRTGRRVIDYGDDTPYRIFAIGGSTTEQAYLDDNRTWTWLLEEGLNEVQSRPVEVINAGVAGLRLVHHLATQDAVEDLNPDLVLFLFGFNDWNRQVVAHFDKDERFGRTMSQRLRVRFEQSVLFTFYKIYIALPQQQTLTVREPHFKSMTDRKSRPDVVRFLPKAVSEEFAENVARLVSRCDEGDYRCMILTQPHGYYLDAPPSFAKYFRLTPPYQPYTLDLESLVHISGLYNDLLRETAASEGLALCDLEATVPKSTDALYDDAHFNNKGARIVAQAMSDCITEQIPEVNAP